MVGGHSLADAVLQGHTQAGRIDRPGRLCRFVEGNSTVTVLLAALLTLAAQAAPEHLVRAADQPRNWLTYSGTYSGQRYSTLAQIDRTNVKNLELKWLLQNQVAGPWESSPLVIDGIMYLTQRPNDVVALDAKSGRVLWNVAVAEFSHGYSITLAPLAVKDKVIIGVGGGEYGIRGFIAAYDAAT